MLNKVVSKMAKSLLATDEGVKKIAAMITQQFAKKLDGLKSIKAEIGEDGLSITGAKIDTGELIEIEPGKLFTFFGFKLPINMQVISAASKDYGAKYVFFSKSGDFVLVTFFCEERNYLHEDFLHSIIETAINAHKGDILAEIEKE